MKRIISILALLLTIIMIFAACGSRGNSSKAAPQPLASSDKSTAQDSTTSAGQSTDVELNAVFLIMGAEPADKQLVEDEVNRILIPKVNVRLKLTPLNFGTAMQQQNLMLSSNEKVDLLMTFPNTYNNLVSKGQVQEIGPLLDQYGQGIKDALGNYLKGSVIKGKIYGVRPISDLAGGGALDITKDVVDKYKIDTTIITRFEELEMVFKTIKDNEPNVNPFSPTFPGSTIAEIYTGFVHDLLGDRFGVLGNYGQDLKVVDLFETKEYSDLLNLLRGWYTKGYIVKNAAALKDDGGTLVKAGKAYCLTFTLIFGTITFASASSTSARSVG